MALQVKAVSARMDPLPLHRYRLAGEQAKLTPATDTNQHTWRLPILLTPC